MYIRNIPIIKGCVKFSAVFPVIVGTPARYEHISRIVFNQVNQPVSSVSGSPSFFTVALTNFSQNKGTINPEDTVNTLFVYFKIPVTMEFLYANGAWKQNTGISYTEYLDSTNNWKILAYTDTTQNQTRVPVNPGAVSMTWRIRVSLTQLINFRGFSILAP
jgi:hypothetical protein